MLKQQLFFFVRESCSIEGDNRVFKFFTIFSINGITIVDAGAGTKVRTAAWSSTSAVPPFPAFSKL